jgi:hypothetical protein
MGSTMVAHHIDDFSFPGQRQAQSQAQSIAQARAAHNAALIEGLDSFRGVNRDPKMHYWDEVSFAA